MCVTSVILHALSKRAPLRSAPSVYIRGGEWFLENRGSRKLFIQSRNLGILYEGSRSLVFSVFISVSKSRIFYASSRSLGFWFWFISFLSFITWLFMLIRFEFLTLPKNKKQVQASTSLSLARLSLRFNIFSPLKFFVLF